MKPKDGSTKTIRNSVIASVVAAFLASFIPQVRQFLWSGIGGVKTGAISLWSFLNLKVEVKILTLTIFAAIFLFLFVRYIAHVLSNLRDKSSAIFTRYTSDTIDDMIWRWQWKNERISTNSIWCYCKKCDATLVYNDSLFPLKATRFICEKCREVAGTIMGGDKYYAISYIERELYRRIRTGEAGKDA